MTLIFLFINFQTNISLEYTLTPVRDFTTPERAFNKMQNSFKIYLFVKECTIILMNILLRKFFSFDYV